MDFDLNEDQQAILEAVEALLEQHAGPARAVALQPKGEYDRVLDEALADAGFSDVARDPEMGGLEAALVVEAVARAGGVVAIGSRALVAPAVREAAISGPIAVTTADHVGPIRFAAHARSLLVVDEAATRLIELAPGECEAVPSNFGYPMGRAPEGLAERGEVIPSCSAARLRDWWRLALAVEAVGTMEAALAQTVGYLKERRQFGRAIGSFQAVQHRLAECAIHVEGSRWLAREAAYHDAPGEAVAAAAAFAMAAAERVFAETHQLSGAIGFTREHDLHVWSMRLQALRLEQGGLRAHRRAVVDARWRGNAA